MSDRWSELRLRKSEPNPNPTQEEPNNPSVPYFGDGQKPSVESSVQVHGLYQEDLTAGIVCAECKRVAEWPDQFGRKRSYAEIVLFNHGVNPKI